MSTVRGLLSLVIVGLVWEIAGRSGRWPLILAPISEIWVKFLQLAATGELTRHVLVSLNEFFVGFAIAAVLGILLGIGRGLVGVVVGEFIGARAGLGYMIFRSSQGFQIDAMWVGVFLLAGTGVLTVSILQRVERRLAPWRQFELK